jgi:hypothetical protein
VVAAMLVFTTAKAAGATRGDGQPNWVGCFLYPLAFVVYLVAGISMVVQNEMVVQVYSGPIQIWFGWRNPAVISIVFSVSVVLSLLMNMARLRSPRLRR